MRIIRMWSQLLKGNEYGTTSRTLHSGEMCRQAGSQVHQRLHLKPAWTLTSLHSQPKKTKAKNRQNYKNTKRAISTAAPLHIPHSVFTHSENNTYPPRETVQLGSLGSCYTLETVWIDSHESSVFVLHFYSMLSELV